MEYQEFVKRVQEEAELAAPDEAAAAIEAVLGHARRDALSDGTSAPGRCNCPSP